MSRGQGSSASLREGLTAVTHSERVAGVTAVSDSSKEAQGREKRQSSQDAAREVPKVQLESGRALEQGSKELVALPSLEVLENQLGKALDNTV